MDNSFIPLIGFIILATVIYAIFNSKTVRVRRKLKKEGYTPMKDFKNLEAAKIVGQIELIDAPLLAPFSQRECACFNAVVEEQTLSRKSIYYSTVKDETVSTRFVIRDGEHIAYINDRNVQSHIVQDQGYTISTNRMPPEHVLEYLQRIKYKKDDEFNTADTLRFIEGILEANEQVAVFGQGTWVSAAQLGLPAELGDVLEIKSTWEDSVYLSDDPSTTLKTMKAAVVKSAKKKKKNTSTIKTEPFKEPKVKENKPSKDRYSRSDGERNYKR